VRALAYLCFLNLAVISRSSLRSVRPQTSFMKCIVNWCRFIFMSDFSSGTRSVGTSLWFLTLLCITKPSKGDFSSGTRSVGTSLWFLTLLCITKPSKGLEAATRLARLSKRRIGTSLWFLTCAYPNGAKRFGRFKSRDEVG
jgi:hypothetical protein